MKTRKQKAAVKKTVENIGEATRESREFREWLEAMPKEIVPAIDGADFKRIACAIGKIELDMVDWMRVMTMARESGKSIEYTLETILEKGLEP